MFGVFSRRARFRADERSLRGVFWRPQAGADDGGSQVRQSGNEGGDRLYCVPARCSPPEALGGNGVCCWPGWTYGSPCAGRQAGAGWSQFRVGLLARPGIIKSDVSLFRSRGKCIEQNLPQSCLAPQHLMKASVPISRGIESLFGTRDENIRVLEDNLKLKTRLLNDAIELEGEADNVSRAASILEYYFALVQEGHVFNHGDLNSYLRVVTGDAETTLRRLVESGRSRSFGKKTLAPKTINQRRYVEAIERNDLVFGVGPAGTGKTYLAVAMAVSALMGKRVSRIILTRPAVEAGERLGFLPGTLQEKVDPYLRPLYDALFDMLEAERVEKLLERNVIEVAPIAFMRGRTLNDSFIILDEAQNSTPEQMKMILTRQGFSSKMVVNGDITQIDLPNARRSGLIDAVEVLKGVEGISFIQFDERDVVRHALVQRIVKAYERYNESIGVGRQLALKLSDPETPAGLPPLAPPAETAPQA